MTRVQTDQVGRNPPVQITVTDDSEQPFVFDRRLAVVSASAQIERFSTVGTVPNRLCPTRDQASPTSRTGHQTTAEQGASRPCICETATGFSPQPLICRNRNCLSKTRSCYSYCGSTESRRRLDRGTADGRTSSGCHSAMVRTHSRAQAMLLTPGNSRRSSTTADSSPRCSKAVRIMAACASLTLNIDGG